MRICLLTPGADGPAQVAREVRHLAGLLAAEHEVVVVEGDAELAPELGGINFADPEHRRSAAVLEAIRAAYPESGPDYLEVPDTGAGGLVALQARLAGEALLAQTLIGVRTAPSSALRSFHDGTLGRPESRRLAELEREQLRLADLLVWPGGDVLDLYRRFYTGLELPEPVRIAIPAEDAEAPPPAPDRSPGAPLRILYAAPLQRHLGAFDLVEACLSSREEDWELTLIGADTPTATMGQSARLTIEAMIAEDPRVRIEEEVGRAELRRRFGAHDLFVAPPRVAAWSEVAIEAMRAGLPVLATPVGGLAEIVEDGVSGWHSDDIGPEALGRALDRLLGDRGELQRVRDSGAPARRGRELSDPAPLLAAYRQLAPPPVARAVGAPATQKLVTGIVPYYGVPQYVGEAVASLLAQTHRKLEVLIVNDGSFAAADSVLADLGQDPRVEVVTQRNRGESVARNLAALLARGEYLVMLDADNLLEPEFVARALAAFEREPDLAYVTSWLRMVDPDGADFPDDRGYAPLGNAVLADETENWDGDSIALLPRRLLTEDGFAYDAEGAMQTDWALYRRLRREGRFGVVIPERLARYRVRSGSLLTGHDTRLHDLAWAESQARNLHPRTRWIASS